MIRTVFVNGEYVPETKALVSIFDRGFLFADGVYEVTSVLEGRLIDNPGHLKRLQRSLDELDISKPATDEEIVQIQKELIKLNQLKEGNIYLQVTRGAADRDFAYPDNIEPSLVLFTQNRNIINSPMAQNGISVISLDDIRWKRRDIKTIGLLAAAMAKQQAIQQGAQDAWMIENGYITEGTSNNAFIITQDDVIKTRPLSNDILHGITRASILKLAEHKNLTIEEHPFTLQEAYQAQEAFVTSATTFVWPVVRIDNSIIGAGQPGPIAQELRKIYIDTALAEST